MQWTTVEGDGKAVLVKAIEKVDRQAPTLGTVMQAMPLSFYPDGQLLRLAAAEGPRWYVYMPGKVVRLDGGLGSIHRCNEDAPLALNDDTVHPYLHFHYFFAEGARLFEARVKRSAVGYTGKIWVFEKKGFFEHDINLTPRGLLTALERVQIPDVPMMVEEEFRF